MRGLKGRYARARAQELAGKFAVSEASVYRLTAHLRKRKTRSDRKIYQAAEADISDPFWFTAGLTLLFDMNARTALELAEANAKGLGVSEGTYNRWLRDAGISRGHVAGYRRPARAWEAARPNDLWQLDFTRSAQYYIDDAGGIAAWGVGERQTEEKSKRRPALIVAQVVDDHSRARYRRGYPTMRSVHVLDFVGRACSEKEDRRHPLFGRPRMIYCDNDAIIWNDLVHPALGELEIEIDAHLPVSREHPDAARGTGKTERQFRVLKDEEKISQIRKWTSLDEFNRWLLETDIVHGNRLHSTTGVPPFARWADIRSPELRQMPREEIFDRLFRQERSASIDAYMRIHVSGRIWQLPYAEPWLGIMSRGERLTYFTHPKKSDDIVALVNGVEHKLHYKPALPDVAAISGGSIKQAPETTIDKLRKQFHEKDYRDINIPMPLDGKDMPIWVPRAGRGEAFDEAKIPPAPTAGVNRVAAIKHLQESGIFSTPITQEEGAWIDAVFQGRGEISDEEMGDLRRRRAG